MSSYREQSNAAKAVRRGIDDARPSVAEKKKPKVKGPWKVVGDLFGTEHIFHHCATEELANKMLRKQHFKDRLRIENRPDMG